MTVSKTVDLGSIPNTFAKQNRGDLMTEEIWKGMIYQGQDYSWRFEDNSLFLRETSAKYSRSES